jgi:hypothetical protein
MDEQRVGRPHDNPAFSCSRRSFLPALLRETVVTLGMLRGGLGCRLSELGALPDDQLAQLKPVVNPAFEILIEEDCVWGRHRKTGAIVRLFSMEERENLLSFNLFDGIHDLGQAGQRLAQEMGWEEARAFAHAKEFFLYLVGKLVCVPKDPPSLMESIRRRPPEVTMGEGEGGDGPR